MAKVADKAPGGKRTNLKLTGKQEAFALGYIELGNGNEAYRRAYNVGTMSDKAISVEVNKLLNNPRVALVIDTKRAESAEKHEITVDFLTEGFLEAVQLAKDTESATALTGAYTALAKLHGQMIEKRKIESDNRHHHSAEPISAFDEFLNRETGAGAETETEGSLPN